MLRSRAVRARIAPWAAIFVVLCAGISVTIDHPYTYGPPIRADGLGYHAWTRALLTGNLNFCQWSSLRTVGAISAANPKHPDRCENKYPAGLALLRMPFMVLVARTSGHDLVPGRGENDMSLALGIVALALTCAFVLASCRLLGVTPLVANAAALAATFGTGLFHYATFDNSFTHVYSAALFAALLYVGLRAARAQRAPHPAALAFLAFFIVYLRPPDLLPLLVLVGAWIAWQVLPLHGLARRSAALRVLVPSGLAVALVAVLQLTYNRWATGHWALSSYGQETFDVGQFREPSVLLSYDRGVFNYYPAIGVLLGAALWHRSTRGWGWTLVGMIAVLTTLYGSWHAWNLGGGFGHRGFVEIAPFAAVAGALGLMRLTREGRVKTIIALAACTFVTLQLMSGFWRGTLPLAQTTGAQYWKHVAGFGGDH